MSSDSRKPLLYILHSSKLHGTERMALDTAQGLKDEMLPILFGPPGPAMEEAEKLGFEAVRFRGAKDFAKKLKPFLSKFKSMTFVATGVSQSAVCLALNILYRRKVDHFQIVHGGSSDQGSYGRKKWLNHTGVRFIAVSDWTKQKLVSYGTKANLVEVVENSLPPDRIAAFPKRAKYDKPGIRNVITVSRVDPMKRIDTLLDALDLKPKELSDISFTIYGIGGEFGKLKDRAAAAHRNVHFPGYSSDIPNLMSQADLLLHTSPEEPFGLVILEAMAANLAILCADAAGPGTIVKDGINGFKFRPSDPAHLAERLCELKDAPPQKLNSVVEGGHNTVGETYSAQVMLDKYRKLFL
jgi:glycosyltransferase involved in cell wall biosynthesis